MVTPDGLTRRVNTWHGPLVRYLARGTGDPDGAEEVAQETFVRALAQESIASERSWLFAVATNLVRDEARRDVRQQKSLALMREEAEAGAVVEPGPRSMERADDRNRARTDRDRVAEREGWGRAERGGEGGEAGWGGGGGPVIGRAAEYDAGPGN